MGIAKQLYQLQEIDIELEANAQALSQAASQLGESQTVVKTRSKLASESQRVEELKRQQHSLEWEIDDLTSKIAPAEDQLYGGRISNPKELANLQREVEALKSKRNQLEDKVLEVMEQVEMAEASVANVSRGLKKLEAEWQNQQQQLSNNIAELRAVLSDLKQRRQTLSTGIDSQVIELYDKLKKGKGTAVAKIEQGICRGCRISLSAAQLQQARADSLVQCSNCGRILFLA